MEIIASVKYDESRHQLVSFLRDGVKPIFIQLMDPRVVRAAVFDKAYRHTVEVLINHFWSTMLVNRNQIVGQMIPVLLADDMWSHVHLVVKGSKNKLVLLVAGQGKVTGWLHISYVGDPEIFKEYMTMLNISDIELYSNLTHLEED